MDKLRAAFLIGMDQSLSAEEVFTNRLSELQAFRLSLEHQLREQAREPSGLALNEPRRNVLTYYGIGGIGKTTLSRRMEESVRSGEILPDLPAKRSTARVDFGESGTLNLEAMLLELRQGLSVLSPRWPAFDFAFGLYWERAHSGESLPDFFRRNSPHRRGVQRMDVAEQMQDFLADVVKELGMVWAPSRIALRLLSLTHEHLVQSQLYRTLSRECPFLEPLIDAEPNTDTLSYFPSLLSWDLANLQRREPSLFVVFLDTFEALSGRRTRTAEKLVQRAVHLLPNALFVVTGRDRVDWAELPGSSELDYVGRARWPLLHFENRQDEPRQHLVGSLSPEDCETYLRQVLLTAEGSPVLGEEFRERIVAGSGGLPLYLDLSVSHYLELLSRGVEVQPRDFGGPLAAVVVRIMRNLPPEELELLRTASLLDEFDAGLLRAAIGPVRDAVITRFVHRTFVTALDDETDVWTLHAQLRETVHEVDQELPDGWSPEEWRTSAERLMSRLGEVLDERRAEHDRLGAAKAFTQAIRLAGRFGRLPDWLLDGAQYLADVGSWESLDVRQTNGSPPAESVRALEAGLRGIVLRRTGSLPESVEAFDEGLAATSIDPGLRLLLTLHRLHSLRNMGRYDEALPEYERLAETEGSHRDRATLQVADIHLLKGRFADALRVVDRIPPAGEISGEILRLRGHVLRFNALFDQAELVYRHALELGRSTGSAALEGKALTNLAETLCWLQPAAALPVAEEAVEFNERIGNQLEVIKAHAARAVAASDRDQAELAVEAALGIVRRSGYRAGAVFAQASRLHWQVRARDSAAARATAEELGRIGAEIAVYRYWAEIAGWWLESVGERPATPPETAAWLEPETVRERWTRVLEQDRQPA
jgi:tetratricopeptide (TPR) repeat protein